MPEAPEPHGDEAPEEDLEPREEDLKDVIGGDGATTSNVLKGTHDGGGTIVGNLRG
jgi:hypothetical protein